MFGRCVLAAVSGVTRSPDVIVTGVTYWAGTCDNDSSLVDAVLAALPRRDVLHCTSTSGYEKSPGMGAVVAGTGIEPVTFHFSGERSYQLSYPAICISW